MQYSPFIMALFFTFLCLPITQMKGMYNTYNQFGLCKFTYLEDSKKTKIESATNQNQISNIWSGWLLYECNKGVFNKTSYKVDGDLEIEKPFILTRDQEQNFIFMPFKPKEQWSTYERPIIYGLLSLSVGALIGGIIYLKYSTSK